MKSHVRAWPVVGSAAFLALVLATAVRGQSTNLINDGTTIARLVRLQNAFGAGTPAAELSVVPTGGGELEASQSPDYTDFPLNGAWYDERYQVATNRYRVQASVRPAVGYPEYVVGVMGWLDATAGKGVAFRLVSGSSAPLQLAAIDFAAAAWETNDSVMELYELDGTPATAALGSAWAAAEGHNPDVSATLSLEVAPASASELALVPGATARLAARAYQPDGVQLGETIEVLTTLPVPGQHRFGYFASWGTSLFPGEGIGYLDTLVFVGELEVQNEPPLLGQAQAWPSPADFKEFKFQATGLGAGKYRVEATTNFVTWTTAREGNITGPTMDFTFPRSTASNALHYRLVVGIP